MESTPLSHKNLQKVADYINERITAPVETGIVLGSGLGALADSVASEFTVSYEEIPGFFKTGIPGHSGKLVVGILGGKRVAVFSGRIHYYEGHPYSDVTLAIQTMKAIGAGSAALSCSVGGLREYHTPGDFVLITDHLNLQGTNPIYEIMNTAKANVFESGPSPFVNMAGIYRADLFDQINAKAGTIGAKLHKGVLASVLGPIYETLAEARMLAALGADVVSMSTVPETIMARYLGMQVGAIAMITNVHKEQMADGPTHEEVLEVSGEAAPKFAALMTKMVELL